MSKGKKTAPKVKKVVEIQVEEQATELSGHSSSSTESESISVTPMGDQEEDEEGIDIFDLIYGSDTESGEEETGSGHDIEYLKRRSLEETPDFFMYFRGVPDIDDISDDISVKLSFTEDQKKIHTKKDVGKFVNPITGEVLEESVKSESSTSTVVVAEVEEKESDEVIEELSELSLPVSIQEPEESEEKLIEDTLQTFLELEKEQEVDTMEIDFEAMIIEEENRRVLNNTLDFITDLINKVVDIMEYVSPEKFLIQNLDKRKLLKELSRIMPTLSVEKKCCEFLNRQVSTYFKHRNSNRNTTNTSSKNLEQDKQKFETAREHLDEVLATETKLLNSSTDLRDGLRKQYNDLKKHVDNLVDDFENLVRKNLHRENRPKLNVLIEQLLTTMRTFRKNISTVRFSMLLHQHTEAQLVQLMDELEDLGNGLTVKEFNNLQAETQTLDKKIEERNNDLNKLYARCRNELHALSHYKEKQQMDADSITAHKFVLNQLITEKRDLREQVFNLKKQRSQLSSEIKKLSAQCGILDKPALMMDYDDTVMRCEEQQAINDYLKRTLAAIERKLHNLLKQSDCHLEK